MTTPSIPRQTHSQGRCSGPPIHPSTEHSDWRCTGCAKLLSVIRSGGRVHLRFGRSHEYFAGFPVVATCRGCGALNQVSASTS